MRKSPVSLTHDIRRGEEIPEFSCPMCDTDNEVDLEDMPSRACDDKQHFCQHCDTEMNIGWVAEIEVRSVVVGSDCIADDQ